MVKQIFQDQIANVGCMWHVAFFLIFTCAKTILLTQLSTTMANKQEK